MIGSVRKAGYEVALGEGNILVQGIADSSDALQVEKAVNALEGVLSAQVNLATERVSVQYVPTIINQNDIRQEIRKAGFKVVDEGKDLEDAEMLARQKEIANQRRYLIIGLIFTLPVFVLSMARDFGLLPMALAHANWLDWTFLVFATIVQFYVGWHYYVNGVKSLRNGSANMDVLVALGTSAAYFYSVAVVLGIVPGHGYFETSAVIITLVRLGKYLEAKAKGGGFIVGGANYGQGSSREHAALAPLYLGIKAVLAKSFARIHAANLTNNGIIPLVFANESDYDRIEEGDQLIIADAPAQVNLAIIGSPFTITNQTKGYDFIAEANLSKRQAAMLLDGGLLNFTKNN